MSKVDNMQACTEIMENEAVHKQVVSGHGFTVDENMFPILTALWERGLETLCSCQGDSHALCDDEEGEHEHPAFIGFVRIEDALTAFKLLDSAQDGTVTLESGLFHSDDPEYVVYMSPLENEESPMFIADEINAYELRMSAARSSERAARLGKHLTSPPPLRTEPPRVAR